MAYSRRRRRRAITIGGFGVEETLKERRIHEAAEVEMDLRSRAPTNCEVHSMCSVESSQSEC
jgi:hypothetical protein